ncbi:MAG: TetR/AcrR family transcriptional regulator [Clostridia bacterium]|nr:TetR/AcrR family transcriptional regulator [Clostridia bacterium]
MDRRQRKTREGIFKAFTALLGEKKYNAITVGEIIERADIGRATFYAHFETKDFLLKELCHELFCHLFDSLNGDKSHHHIFDCDAPDSIFLHLFCHIQKNDNRLLQLLSGENNDLFLRYFKDGLYQLVSSQLDTFKTEKNNILPDDYLINHICSTFTETVLWWAKYGCRLSAQQITEYFFAVV